MRGGKRTYPDIRTPNQIIIKTTAIYSGTKMEFEKVKYKIILVIINYWTPIKKVKSIK